MTALTFDTHKLVKLLKKSGFSDTQSEGMTNALSEVIETDNSLATKQDIQSLEFETKQAIQSLKFEIETLEDKLTIKFGKMLVVAVGVIVAFDKFL